MHHFPLVARPLSLHSHCLSPLRCHTHSRLRARAGNKQAILVDRVSEMLVGFCGMEVYVYGGLGLSFTVSRRR